MIETKTKKSKTRVTNLQTDKDKNVKDKSDNFTNIE